ncbi:PolC-type DNA polymerase III [Flavobacteriaceae bacterium M23B6Z8]
MIFKWRKNKKGDYPEYWQNYINTFLSKPVAGIEDTTFVVFDTETTGFDFNKDRILCIGALKLKGNDIEIGNVFERYIQQEHFNPKTVEIHGILKENTAYDSEEDAIVDFLAYLENAVIVAHHAYFDITMINYALKRLGLPKLKNKVIDTGVLYRKTRISSHLIEQEKNYTLDELADLMHISKKDRHTALGDAYITALVFLKTLSKLKKGHQMTLKQLLKLVKY